LEFSCPAIYCPSRLVARSVIASSTTDSGASTSFNAEEACLHCQHIEELAKEYGAKNIKGEQQGAIIVEQLGQAGHDKRCCGGGNLGSIGSMFKCIGALLFPLAERALN